MEMTRDYLDRMGRIERLNLINSITGVKPANLVGTRSSDGTENLAIFNSAIHIGSNPPLIGILFRPTGEVPRHSYEHIQATGFFTLNSLPASLTKAGHYTAAKFESDESEFEACGFTPRYQTDFPAPFVEESAIQIGLKKVDEQLISLNQTRLVIGEVCHLHIDEKILTPEGYLDLEKADVAGISGLNSYYRLKKESDYPYPRKEEWVKNIPST